jgi:hypothetical protein
VPKEDKLTDEIDIKENNELKINRKETNNIVKSNIKEEYFKENEKVENEFEYLLIPDEINYQSQFEELINTEAQREFNNTLSQNINQNTILNEDYQISDDILSKFNSTEENVYELSN